MNKTFWRNKRVLITGHTGFKGAWLVLLLNHLNAKLFGIGLNPISNRNLFEDYNLQKSIKSYIEDIRNYDIIKKIITQIKPDIIIHLAAQAFVRKSYDDPIATYSTNVMGTANLLDISRSISNLKVFLNVTTDKCYENKNWIWGYRENDNLGGSDPYSSSKACSEILTNSFNESFLKNSIGVATARAGNVIGGGDYSEDRLVPDILDSFFKNKNIILRNPDSIRPWQHVLEPLSGYLLLIENLYKNPKKFSGSWNFGPNPEDAKSVKYVTDYLIKKSGKDLKWKKDLKKNPHEEKILNLDISKSLKLLGWKPLLNLDKSLDLVMDWHNASLDENHSMFSISNRQISNYLNLLQ